jgi:ketosteroid isomerase-like protein
MSRVGRAPNAVKRYFEADAERDIDAVVELFAGDATVIDEGQTRRGPDEIREWQAGPASQYEYRVTITREERLADGRYRVVARLDGNFPGGTASLNFDFGLDGELIRSLVIAP